MSDWIVIPCLLTLRSEFNAVNPNRDKGADGTIGDSNHTSTSDHTPDEDSDALRNKDADSINEVHALDIDSTGPWPDGKGGEAGGWFDKKIHQLIAEEKRRWLDPNDMCRLRYIIWRGYIYHIDNDFEPKVYTGSSDKHFDHAHFSARYETRAENDTRPWRVKEDMPLDSTDLNAIVTKFRNTPEVLSDTNVGIIGNQAAASTDAKLATRFAAIDAKLSALIASEAQDDTKKDQAIAAIQAAISGITPMLVNAVTDRLAEIAPNVQVTQTQVNEAMETALRNVFAPSA